MSSRDDQAMAVPPRIARARRDARAKKAKVFINKTVPAILKSNARARRGVEAACLVVDPPKYQKNREAREPLGNEDADGRHSSHLDNTEQKPRRTSCPEKQLPPMSIKLRVLDTLEAAAHLAQKPPTSTSRHQTSHSKVAILNMASPLRPGGGVLTGATSQEEWLCARTTLYHSLREDYYRLPDIGGVYTPDVLVCRHWDEDAADLPNDRRFFVDVVTAAMLRMPDVEDGMYAEERDREMVHRKMRAVLRMVRSKGIDRLVLGAWGCGAYGNPVGEVARAWRKVLCGGGKGRAAKRAVRETGDATADREGWDGLEVVFAVKDRRMAEAFADAFGDELVVEEDEGGNGNEHDEVGDESTSSDGEL